MVDIIISGGKRGNYEEFAQRYIPDNVRPLCDSVRQFCLSLGSNVVEDVRMHRVVFGKTMSFRWFADVKPEPDGLIVKIQKSRKEPIQTIILKDAQDIAKHKQIIRQAWEEIT